MFVLALEGMVRKEILYGAVEYLGYFVKVAQIVLSPVTFRFDMANEVFIFPDLNR